MYYCNRDTYTAYVNQVLPATSVNTTQASVDYIATFGYIAVKRPEIFEAGRKMHQLLNTAANMPTIHDHVGIKIAEVIDPCEGFTTAIDIQVPTQIYNVEIGVVINVLYTEENLRIIRDFFDSQALYPELWDNLEDTEYYKSANRGSIKIPTSQNSRFFHFNKYTTNNAVNPHNETFGDDAFTQRASPNNIEMTTAPVFFDWDETKRDTYIDPKNFTSYNFNGVSYGFAIPYTMHNYDQYGTRLDDVVLIELRSHDVGGIPLDLFTDPPDVGYKLLKYGRRCGYDHHATAYSTAIITPYSGYSNTDIGVTAPRHHDNGTADTILIYPTQINHIRPKDNATGNTTDFNAYMTQTYIGANNPAIEYNTTTNRFELKRFHTGNNVGNLEGAGNPAVYVNNKGLTPPHSTTERLITSVAKNNDAGNTVYKINPRPPQFGFSPNFKPYARYNQAYRILPYPEMPDVAITDITKDGVNTNRYSAMNPNIEPYEIFDAHGGIYIDDWGFDEDNWEDNFWDILGFDYYAVNAPASSKNVLTRRVNNENSNALYRATTNAEVVQTDTKNFITNQFGAVQYYTSLPFPSCIPNFTVKKQNGTTEFYYALGDAFTAQQAQPLEVWNEVTVLTQSTTITASDIQKSVLRPYYTIRSNILEGATAIGGNPTGANLPIIAIVDKYSAASDYFMGNQSIEFTVTKPTMVADITTSIHDSDGEYANVDRTSAVIYKITKVRRTPVGIIDEILEGEKKQNKNKK
jgi:hypothetical protein